MSTYIPVWLVELTDGCKNDAQTCRLVAELSGGNSQHRKFALKDGVLCYDGRTRIGNNAIVQKRIIQSMHSSAIGGHSGFQVTYHKTKKLIAWPLMKKDIQSFVGSCTF